MADPPVSPKLLQAWNHLGYKSFVVLPRELRNANQTRRHLLWLLAHSGRKS